MNPSAKNAPVAFLHLQKLIFIAGPIENHDEEMMRRFSPRKSLNNNDLFVCPRRFSLDEDRRDGGGTASSW